LTARRVPSGSNRNMISLVLIGLGILLLLLVPLYLVVLAFAGARNVDLHGTLVILSVVIGMALVVVGSAIRE
jgi:hypothetical protein